MKFTASRRYVLRRHNQVAFVFPVLIVHNDEELAGFQVFARPCSMLINCIFSLHPAVGLRYG